ncbi:hypothetical protein [Stenotrophomonas oahuensis]|uniref:Transmembrane protein n=1 Tax=Stenotrophomonas oahuensis TaxID=3003271 RepID=A0ABY9YNS9_9GAMM|nr:hypothetical protein [Stenotrophomonas sp. A5586]WNH52387.1 hypothetical protein PDM29_18975 [Stenotrophomonas sp. A5586]
MIEGMLDIFGTRLTLTFAAIALLYLLWSTAPIWWPMQRVLRRKDLQQRWSFVFTALALIYGATALVLVPLVAMLKLHELLVQPAHLPWSWIVTPGAWVIEHDRKVFAAVLALSPLLLTWWITRTLATHWTVLCTRSATPPKDPR